MIVDASWPTYDESKIKTNTVEIAVQINGKIKANDTVYLDIENEKVVMK